jgi:hypothetical protein
MKLATKLRQMGAQVITIFAMPYGYQIGCNTLTFI